MNKFDGFLVYLATVLTFIAIGLVWFGFFYFHLRISFLFFLIPGTIIILVLLYLMHFSND